MSQSCEPPRWPKQVPQGRLQGFTDGVLPLSHGVRFAAREAEKRTVESVGAVGEEHEIMWGLDTDGHARTHPGAHALHSRGGGAAHDVDAGHAMHAAAVERSDTSPPRLAGHPRRGNEDLLCSQSYNQEGGVCTYCMYCI